MPEDKYAATWRGARKHQFDEEARLKRRSVVPFRTVKHGDPVKFKVLVEDLAPKRRLELPFLAIVAVVAAAAFAVGFLVL